MMASLSNLPNELLLEIWRHVLHPEDIESFALTSKNIRALADRFLEEHRTLTKNFSTCSTFASEGTNSAAGLLKEITINPRGALYVKELVINIWRDSWDSPAWQASFFDIYDAFSETLNDGIVYLHKPYAETDMQIFEQVVKRNEKAFGNDMFEPLIKAIRDGREDPILALLLLLLTNLRYLKVETMNDHPHFSQALHYVSNARNAEALSRLSEVKLLHRQHTSEHLLEVKAFATLPSVKEITGWEIGKAANPHRLKFDLPPRSSNVESLTYEWYHGIRGGIDAVAFSELIKGFKGLKRFNYVSGSDHKMFAIRNALVAHARSSLETLDLKPFSPTRKSIGSFRGFKALKKLEIDHMHFADFDPRRGTGAVDILPSSLEELHLHDYHVRMDPLHIGQKILEGKDTYVPNLTFVALYNDNPNLSLIGSKPDPDATAIGIAKLQAIFSVKRIRLEIWENRRVEEGDKEYQCLTFGDYQGTFAS